MENTVSELTKIAHHELPWVYNHCISVAIDTPFIHFESVSGSEYGEVHLDGTVLFRDGAKKPTRRTRTGFYEFQSIKEFTLWRHGRVLPPRLLS